MTTSRHRRLVSSTLALSTEITFARFFGACEGDYGTSQDVAHARGECGVMTTLVNLFNATNKENIVVKPQIIEWGPYYQQLNARIAAHDIPTIAVMHTAQLGDYTRYVEPLDDMPHHLAQVFEIEQQPSLIEFLAGKRHPHLVVMAVRVFALSFVVAQVVPRGKRILDRDLVHEPPK